ncbi:MAG: pentapeptide repeat-containing protein [Bacteroidota bacterium]
MSATVFADEHYKQKDFLSETLSPGTYDNCQFTSCQFTGLDLSGFRFTECQFEDCDLSNVILTKTALQEVVFLRSKLLGIHFSACRTFRLELKFEHCVLDYSSFVGLPLPGTTFLECQIREADFREADLSKSSFEKSNLSRSQFEYTNLEGADLRTAIHFLINPEENRLKGAQFSASNLSGLLAHYGLKIED